MDAADWLRPRALRGRSDALKRTEDAGDADALARAIAATAVDTIVGPLRWGSEDLPPFASKNIAKTPLVGGQWRRKEGGGYEIVIVDNQSAPEIPAADRMQPIG